MDLTSDSSALSPRDGRSARWLTEFADRPSARAHKNAIKTRERDLLTDALVAPDARQLPAAALPSGVELSRTLVSHDTCRVPRSCSNASVSASGAKSGRSGTGVKRVGMRDASHARVMKDVRMRAL